LRSDLQVCARREGFDTDTGEGDYRARSRFRMRLQYGR
jgi:hypothetical protein